MDRILVFLFGVPLGILIIIYRYQMKGVTGDIGFAEKYLGSGGTYTLFVLVGIAVCVLSVMYAFGTLQGFFSGNFGQFFS